MASITVSLAGIPVGIELYSPDTGNWFSEYLCDDSPCFTVGASPEDLEYERVQTTNYHRFKGLPAREWSDSYLERLALLRLIANRMVDYDVILFHSAIIALDGKAYLFAAPSGTGKTTHIRLWLSQFPRAYVLNGDKPFLKAGKDGRIMACGTPWRGKEHFGVNEILPLQGICLLERAPENRIRPLALNEAMNLLLRQAHIPKDPAATLKALRLVETIGQNTRLFRMGCNMDPEAAFVSRRAMVDAAAEVLPDE